MGKKHILFVLLSALIIFSSTTYGQVLLEENFDYSAGDLLSDHGWTAYSSAGSNSITVNNGGLTYDGYASSDVGNAALLDNNGEDVNKAFSSQTTGTIYYSFLFNVQNVISDYFIYLYRSSSNFAARVYISGSDATFKLGISNTSTAPSTFGNTILNTNTTYLCIVKYDVSSSGDASLWVFSSGVPASEAIAGTPEATTTGSGQTTINAIALRQYNSSENIIIDGIRVATTWSGAPLPVELTSFTASITSTNVNLKWNTATEVNNFGFDIQRSAVKGQQSTKNWDKIGFVRGNGNSNSPKNYSFVDENVNSGKYYYRLKQTDFDGKFAYSKIIDADIAKPDVYSLGQNYPNPFNPVTAIKYEIPKAGKVNLVVYDMLGREVKALVNEYQEAGRYDVKFNADRLASGTYFYEIQTGNYIEVKKMILLK